MRILIIIAFWGSIITFTVNAQIDSIYLNQVEPENTPIKFNLLESPGYFAAERVAISNDGKEIFYSELNGYNSTSNTKIKYYRYTDGTWNGPEILFENFFSPSLSVDGKKMFFQKISGIQKDIWYSVKSDTGWGLPAKFLPNHPLQYMLWETNSGNYYCSSSQSDDNIGSLDFSELIIDSNDTIFKSLGIPLNKKIEDLDFFVSRDESFIILSRSNYSSPGNLNVSYHKPDGSWTNPKDLNLSGWAPYVTSDNKYLFYTGDWNSPTIYWVKIDNLIDSLKHTNYLPYVLNEIPDQTDSIGHEYSFTIPDSIFKDDDENEVLTLSVTLSNGANLPDSLVFDPITNTIYGKILETGTYTIKVTATDAEGANVYNIFQLTINEGSTSIYDTDIENKLLIFPNPASHSIQIKTDKYYTNISSYIITDMSGRIIKQAKLNSTTIDLSELNKGTFILSLKIDEGIICKKIIVE